MTVSLRTTSGVILAATCAWLLAGCATREVISDEAKVEQARLAKYRAMQNERESNFNSKWQGRPYEELRQQLGEPPLMMNVLGSRALRTSLLVYTENVNEANCIDAFTMIKAESDGHWLVADYFCR